MSPGIKRTFASSHDIENQSTWTSNRLSGNLTANQVTAPYLRKLARITSFEASRTMQAQTPLDGPDLVPSGSRLVDLLPEHVFIVATVDERVDFAVRIAMEEAAPFYSHTEKHVRRFRQ